jgi:hypothetical protein
MTTAVDNITGLPVAEKAGQRSCPAPITGRVDRQRRDPVVAGDLLGGTPPKVTTVEG